MSASGTWEEAQHICGKDPDFLKRNMWNAVERVAELEWTAKVQIMHPDHANPEGMGLDPFDVAKVWPRDQFPKKGITTWVSICTKFPVNCPLVSKAFATLNFDGESRSDANHNGYTHYAPNSFTGKFRPDLAEVAYAVNDNIVSRESHYWHEGKQNECHEASQI
ncbi:catalase-like domain-containing protein [Xylariaceae sp. FL0255]|nr:catalase-like domain-containing protein [Xylariaceae sp. FL0255]